jgi:hypothetical protein
MMKVALAVLLLVSGLSETATASPEQQRTCRIFYMDPPRDAPREAYLFDGTNSQKVSLPSMNFSEVINLPPGEIILGMTPEKILSKEDFPSTAPSTSIPADARNIYLLVGSDADNQIMPVKLQAYHIVEDFEPGKTLWINLIDQIIMAELGSQSLSIPPFGRVISAPPLDEAGYFRARFFYQPQGTNEPLPIMNKSWWFDPNSRNVGFIVYTKARFPKIFTVRDKR